MRVAKLVFLVGLVLIPWLASLYLHFWLEYTSEWSADRPLRGVISLIVIAAGMGSSFMVYLALFYRTK